MSSIRDFLNQQSVRGAWSIGQIAVDGWSLRHLEDTAAGGLTGYQRPADARELAKYDDAGSYRPLKTAPNLRHGWRLDLASADELRLALDFFYPAALGTWLENKRGRLIAVPLRQTLGRQSGMYRVAQLITTAQAEAVIQRSCREGCLRRRLWKIEDQGVCAVEFSLPLPILCVEACNLLVAACRPVAKENLPKVEAAS